MDLWHQKILMQLCMMATIGLIGVECVVLYLTQDLYYIFIMAVLVVTYYAELIYYIKLKISKKCVKKVDKRKRIN